ncbi:MAG: DUF2062 domain-containing protein [Candidatus Omnitrophota bacterium]|jgi:uncharacterized protein (DUF2062 family)
MKKNNNNKPRGLWRENLARILQIKDTPQKISLGFGLGIFLGIFPGSGPIGAVVLATLFRINRLSSLAGSLLTNTWLSLATIPIAIKIGSGLLGLHWQKVANDWTLFLRDFHWANILKLSLLKMALAPILGLIIIGLTAGIIGYLSLISTFLIIKKIRRVKQ